MRRVRQWVVSFPDSTSVLDGRDSRLLDNDPCVVIRTIAGFQRKRAKSDGFDSGESGSVTLVQRFGGSANLNIHFHTLMIEGVYREDDDKAFFHDLDAPSNEDSRSRSFLRFKSASCGHSGDEGYAVDRNPESNEPEYENESRAHAYGSLPGGFRPKPDRPG